MARFNFARSAIAAPELANSAEASASRYHHVPRRPERFAMWQGLSAVLILFVASQATAQPAGGTTASFPPAEADADLAAQKAQVEERSDALRNENSTLRQRIAELEKQQAALRARDQATDAKLAEVQERLERLQAERDD